jgi:hypothetical protein
MYTQESSVLQKKQEKPSTWYLHRERAERESIERESIERESMEREHREREHRERA